tara:strand:+ start:17029 stop:17220 length:192 start_codon:yes stop_codon:yes gene_type:complete
MYSIIENVEQQTSTLFNANWRGNVNCLSFCAENLGYKIFKIYNERGEYASKHCKRGSLLMEKI